VLGIDGKAMEQPVSDGSTTSNVERDIERVEPVEAQQNDEQAIMSNKAHTQIKNLVYKAINHPY
jgi:hypothetical protein